MKNILLVLVAAFAFSFCGIDAISFSSAKPASLCSIVGDNGLLIGGAVGMTQKNAKSMHKLISGNERYTLINGFRVIQKSVKGSKVTLEDPMEVPIIRLATNKEFDVAISCNWNPLPKVPKMLDRNNSIYKKIIVDLLKEHGVKVTNPVITQVYKVDLDNDKTDEVLINASNISFKEIPIRATANTYSFTVVRKIVGGKVKNLILQYFFVPSNFKQNEESPKIAYVNSMVTFLDVNHDNKLEVLLKERYYEGQAYIIYQWKDGKFIEAYYNGVGA